MPEEMVRIPLAIRWPGRVAPGLACDRLVSNVDLAPTILDAAGLALARDVDGTSLLPLGSGPNAPWRDDLL